MNNLHVTIEASDEEAVKRLCAKVKEILKKVEQVQKLELSRQTKKIAIQNTIFKNLPELQFSDYEDLSFNNKAAFDGMRELHTLVASGTIPLNNIYLPANGGLRTFKCLSLTIVMTDEEISQIFEENPNLVNTEFWNWQKDTINEVVTTKKRETDIRLKGQHRIRVKYPWVSIEMKCAPNVKIMPELFSAQSIERLSITADANDNSYHYDEIWPLIAEFPNVEEMTLVHLKSEHGPLADVILEKLHDIQEKFMHLKFFDFTVITNHEDLALVRSEIGIIRQQFQTAKRPALQIRLLVSFGLKQYASIIETIISENEAVPDIVDVPRLDSEESEESGGSEEFEESDYSEDFEDDGNINIGDDEEMPELTEN